MLALWQDIWRTAPLLTSPRPLLLEAAGHRENFPSCFDQKICRKSAILAEIDLKWTISGEIALSAEREISPKCFAT